MNVPQWVPAVAMGVMALAMVFGVIQRFLLMSRAGYGATIAYVLMVGGLAGFLLFGGMIWYRKQVAEAMTDQR